MTTANTLLRQLLGEATEDIDEPAGAKASPSAPLSAEKIDKPADAEAAAPIQELVQMWKTGERMGVAARLMFTEASYVDFVDLVFALGQEAGHELGRLLDELADTEGIEPPKTPPQYHDLLQRVAGASEEESIL